MHVSIRPDAAAATKEVVIQIAALVANRANVVLGLATGGTMEPVYDGLIAAHRAGLSFAGTTTFNLDEYVGLGAGHPNAYRSYMQARFFDHVDIDPTRIHLPDGHDADPAAAALRYEALIARHGPIDLQLLGLGRNGHIAFNEPTSSLGSRTRVKLLMPGTRAANSRFFDHPDQTPRLSITMGIATILEARKVLLLALGADKAEPVAQMVEGPISALCPGTALQMHPATRVVLDMAAGTGLIHAEYYRAVEESGL